MKTKKRYYLTIKRYADHTDTQLWNCTHEQASTVLLTTCDFILPLDRKPRKVENIRIA